MKNYNEINDNEIVCTCYSITLGEIKQEIKNDNSITIDKLNEKLGTGKFCKKCLNSNLNNDKEYYLNDILLFYTKNKI